MPQCLPATAQLLNWTLIVLLASGALIGIMRRNHSHRAPACLLFACGAAMLVAAVLGWNSDVAWTLPFPLYLGMTPFALGLDALSAIFVGLLGVVTMSVSLFSPGYLPHHSKNSNLSCYWAEMFFFVCGMLGVLLSSNAISFLVFWELFALSSTLMIATDLQSHDCKLAAFIYLGATRVATALLMGGFLWMYWRSHSLSFGDWQFQHEWTLGPALLILIGLCIKSGIWPFHNWLPYAHPAAPSPVSALMSGVMIKVSLYALIRLLVLGGDTSLVIGYVMLVLGTVSAFWGVLFALMQHDLKRLLAYHSIENVGLILMGLGLAVICRHSGLPLAGTIALGGAIFHCVNHGLFKSALFLGAGTIDSRLHTRDLERLGGLARGMPWTMACFVVASAAICALPPLNGFSSKWMVYQGLFNLARYSGSLWYGSLAVACIAVLALVSGLALYCFTKAIGVTFLGRPRSPEAEHVEEGTTGMIAAQVLLVLCCIGLGVGAPVAMAVIQPVCALVFPAAPALTGLYTIPMGSFAFVTALVVLSLYGLLSARRSHMRWGPTWECGFGELGEHMQASATGFAENAAFAFAPLLRYKTVVKIKGRDRRHFPDGVEVESQTESILEQQIYLPVVRLIRAIGGRIVLLQTGSIHLYLAYFLLMLVVLMLIGIFA